MDSRFQKIQDDTFWPLVTVIVCVYNGESTIELCMRELAKVDYPNFESIFVDDGSTDSTRPLVETNLRLHSGFRSLSIGTNRGLSHARNQGLENAQGEIVVYLDSDAYPSDQWLKQIVTLFLNSHYIAVGGPNLNPPHSNLTAKCVDHSPGSPVCVLRTETEAEHIAGCNLAVRKNFLRAIGGFNPIYRVAGDDVDVCWRIQKYGGKLGFAPDAIVWHCRRETVKGYLKQQRGYGRAEALLARHWPEKFNRLGHITWPKSFSATSSVYGTPLAFWTLLPQLPEWNFLNAVLILAGFGGFVWSPLFYIYGIVAASLLLSIIYALAKTLTAPFAGSFRERLQFYALTSGLNLGQPLARLYGRIEYGLHPWSAFRLKVKRLR